MSLFIFRILRGDNINSDNVYVAVYHNNVESIFYKKNSHEYIDLKSKCTVFDTDLFDIIPYSKIIPSTVRTKYGIIKLYEMDRNKPINLNRVFVGNVCVITDVIIDEWPKKSKWDIVLHSRFNVKQLYSNQLLYVMDESNLRLLNFAGFINMITNDCYENKPILKEKDLYIPTDFGDLKSVRKELDLKEHTLEKGKLLEKYRNYMKKYL